MHDTKNVWNGLFKLIIITVSETKEREKYRVIGFMSSLCVYFFFFIHFACSTCIFNFNGADGNKQWAIITEKRVPRTFPHSYKNSDVLEFPGKRGLIKAKQKYCVLFSFISSQAADNHPHTYEETFSVLCIQNCF